MSYKISETVSIVGSDNFLRNSTIIPIPPFVGLVVGGLVISRVYVNQGCVDDNIEVEYEPVTEMHADTLEKFGWTWEYVE